jgi:predicted ATPase with chaperone activity
MVDIWLVARAQLFHNKAISRTPDGKMPGESRSTPREIQNYLGRISGPLLDRIDLHIEVPQVKFREITSAWWRRVNASKSVLRKKGKSPATPAWAAAS